MSANVIVTNFKSILFASITCASRTLKENVSENPFNMDYDIALHFINEDNNNKMRLKCHKFHAINTNQQLGNNLLYKLSLNLIKAIRFTQCSLLMMPTIFVLITDN